MAWTDTARREHKRKFVRYPSDLTDGEWALIAPMFPAARRKGRPRTTCLRKVMDAILYIASSGCAWRMLPNCFPAISTVRGYFYAWRDKPHDRRCRRRLILAQYRGSTCDSSRQFRLYSTPSGSPPSPPVIAFYALRLGPSLHLPIEQGKDSIHAKAASVALVVNGFHPRN